MRLDEIKNKRILLVANYSLDIGGIQSVIMSIVRNLSSEYTFDVIVFSGENDYYSKEFLSYGGKIFVIPHYYGSNRIIKKIESIVRPISDFFKIKKILKKNGPYDAIHCHNFLDSAIYIYTAKKCGIPIRLVHSHSCFGLLPKYKIISRTYNAVYRNIILKDATSIVACSKGAGDWMCEGKKEYIVINNAIDLNKFKYTNVNQEIINPYSFVHVGRWMGPKNQVFLLKIINEIKKTKNGVSLSLIGYGLDKDKKIINDEIEDLNLKDNIIFYSKDSNISEILSKNNIFVFPSLFEGLGIALIEAQATGMKCFASDTVPKEADLGLVDFLPLDNGPKYWAERIIEYIEENGNKRRFVSMDAFDIKRIIKQYDDLYKGIIK